MKSPDDLDEDLDLTADLTADDDGIADDLLNDDDLDAYASQGGGKSSGSSESQLAAKYADYLMWSDTGSSHDEALDLASMSEAEFEAAEAADNADSSNAFGSLDDDNFDDDEDEDEGYSSGNGSRRSSSTDNDDY